jgi:hypothetical protein
MIRAIKYTKTWRTGQATHTWEEEMYMEFQLENMGEKKTLGRCG